MILLMVKGRGYYNGYTCDSGTDYSKNKRGESDRFDFAIYKIKFKRDYNQVKSTYTFNSVEDAQKAIGDIASKLIKKGVTKVESVWNMGWRQSSIPCHCITTTDVSALEKALAKIEIVEENDYMVFKKSNRLSSRWSIKIFNARDDDTICKTCRINLTPNEPYFRLSDVLMCKHCVEQLWNHMEPKYDAHPNADQIETAWKAEMVTREI